MPLLKEFGFLWGSDEFEGSGSVHGLNVQKLLV